MAASGWHPEDIKAEIRKRGTTLGALALSNGMHRDAISIALKVPHQQAEAVVARFLDVPAHELWPARYDAKGRRLQPQPGGYVIAKPAPRARSNEAAA